MLYCQISDFQKIGSLHCRFTQTPGGHLLKLLPGRAKAFLEGRYAAKNVKKRPFLKSETPGRLLGDRASLRNLWSVRSVPVIFIRLYKTDAKFSPIYSTKSKNIIKIDSQDENTVVNAPLKRGLPAQDASNEIKKIAFRIKKDIWKKKIKETPSLVSSKKEIYLPPTRSKSNPVSRTGSNDLVFNSNPVNQLKKKIIRKRIENFTKKSSTSKERYIKIKGITPHIPLVVNASNNDLPSPFFFVEKAHDNLLLRSSYSYPSKKDKSKIAEKVGKKVKHMVPNYDKNTLYPSPKLAEIKRSFDGSTSIIFNSAKRKLDSLCRIKTRSESTSLSKIMNKVIPIKNSNENQKPLFPSPIFNQKFVDKLFSGVTDQNNGNMWPLEKPIKSYRSNENQSHLKKLFNRYETSAYDDRSRLVNNSIAKNKLMKESSGTQSGKLIVDNMNTLIEGNRREEKENVDKLILEAKSRINGNLWPLKISAVKSLENYKNQNYQTNTLTRVETLNENKKDDSTTKKKLTSKSSDQYLNQATAAVSPCRSKGKNEDVKISFADETHRINSHLWSLDSFNNKYPGFYKSQISQNISRRVETLSPDGVRRNLTDTLTTRDILFNELSTQQNSGVAFSHNQLSLLSNCDQDMQKALPNSSSDPDKINNFSGRKIETLFSINSDGVHQKQFVDKSPKKNNSLNQSSNIIAELNHPVQDNSIEIIGKQENNQMSKNISPNEFFALKKCIQNSRNISQTNRLISNLSETTKSDPQKYKLFTWSKLKSLEVQNYCNSQMNRNAFKVNSSNPSKTILTPSEGQNMKNSTSINENIKDSNLILWNLINANLQVPQKLGSQNKDADFQDSNVCMENLNNSSTSVKNEDKTLDQCNSNIVSKNNKIYGQGLVNNERDDFSVKSNAEYSNQNNTPSAILVASDDKNDQLPNTIQPKYESNYMLNQVHSHTDNVTAKSIETSKEINSVPTSQVEISCTFNHNTSLETNTTPNTLGYNTVIEIKNPSIAETLSQFEVDRKGEVSLKQTKDHNIGQNDNNQTDNYFTVTPFLLTKSGTSSSSECESKIHTTQEASFGMNQLNISIENQEQYCEMNACPEVANQCKHQSPNQKEISKKTEGTNEFMNYQEPSGNSTAANNSSNAYQSQFLQPNSGASSKSDQNNLWSELSGHLDLQTVPATQEASFGKNCRNKFVENLECNYKLGTSSEIIRHQDHHLSNKVESCRTAQTNNYQEFNNFSKSDKSSTAFVQCVNPPNVEAGSKSDQNNHMGNYPDYQELQTTAQKANFGTVQVNNKSIKHQEQYYKINDPSTSQQVHQLSNLKDECKIDHGNAQINYQEFSGKISTPDNQSTAIVPPSSSAAISNREESNLLSEHHELQSAPVVQEASYGADNQAHYYKMNASDVIKQQEYQLPNQELKNEINNYLLHAQPQIAGSSSKREQSNLLNQLQRHQEPQSTAQEANFGTNWITKKSIENQEQYHKMNTTATSQQGHQLSNQKESFKTNHTNDPINYKKLSDTFSTTYPSTANVVQLQQPNVGTSSKCKQNNILGSFSDQQVFQSVPVAQEPSFGKGRVNISMENQEYYYKMNGTFEVICQDKHQLPNQGESYRKYQVNELINNYQEPYNNTINSSDVPKVQIQPPVQEVGLKTEQIDSGSCLSEFKNASSNLQYQLPIQIENSKHDQLNLSFKNQELDSKINEIKGPQLSSSNKEITELTNQLIQQRELDKVRVFPEIRNLQPQSSVQDVSSSANNKHELIKNKGSNGKKEASHKVTNQTEFQLSCHGLSFNPYQANGSPKIQFLDHGGNTKTDQTNNTAVNNTDSSLKIYNIEPFNEKERGKIDQRNCIEESLGFNMKSYSEVLDKNNQKPRLKKLSDFGPSGPISHPFHHPCELNEQNQISLGKTHSSKNHQSDGNEKLEEKKIEKSAMNPMQNGTLQKLEGRNSLNLSRVNGNTKSSHMTSGDKSPENKEILNYSEDSGSMFLNDKFDGNNHRSGKPAYKNNEVNNSKNLRNSFYHIGKAAFYLENILKSEVKEKKEEKLNLSGSTQRGETASKYAMEDKNQYVQPVLVKQNGSREKYKDSSQESNNQPQAIINYKSRFPVHKDKSGSSSNYSPDDENDKRKSIYKLLEEISNKSDLTNLSGIYSYKKIDQINKGFENKSSEKYKHFDNNVPTDVNVSTTQGINAVKTFIEPTLNTIQSTTNIKKELEIENKRKDANLDWFNYLKNKYNSINIKEELNQNNETNTIVEVNQRGPTIMEPPLRPRELSEKEEALHIEFYNKSSSTGAIDTIPPNLVKNSNPFEWEKQKKLSDWSSSISFPSKYHNLYESSKVYPPTTETQALPEHLINMDANNYSFQRLGYNLNQNYGGYDFNRSGYNYIRGGYNYMKGGYNSSSSSRSGYNSTSSRKRGHNSSSSRGGSNHFQAIPNNSSINNPVIEKRLNKWENTSITPSVKPFDFSQLQPKIGPSLLTDVTKYISDYLKKIINKKEAIKLDAYESIVSTNPLKPKIKFIESTSNQRKQVLEQSLSLKPLLSKKTLNKMTEPLNPIIGKINKTIDGGYMKSALYDNTMKSISKAAFARRIAKTPTPANIPISGSCPTCDRLSQLSSNIQKGVPFMKTKKKLVSCNFCKGYRNNERDDKFYESSNTAKEIYNNAVKMFSRSDDSPLNYITKSRTGVGSNGTKYSYRISKSATIADTDSSSIQSMSSSSSINERLSEESSVKNSVKISDSIQNQDNRIEKSLSNIGNTIKKKTSNHLNLPDSKTAVRKHDDKDSKKSSKIMALASRMVSKRKANAIKNPYKSFSDISL